MAYTGIPHELSSDSIRLVLVDDEAWNAGDRGGSNGTASTGVREKGVKGITDEIDRLQLSGEKLRGKDFIGGE